MRDSMVFYRSFFEAIKDLNYEQQGIIFNAIFDYGLNFNEPKLDGICKTIWTLIKPQLDANIKKFNNGKQPKQKQNRSKVEAKQKQNRSKTQANVNDNVNDNVNNIDSRKLKFASTLEPYLNKFGRELLNDFYAYWTEPNKSNTKFKQELEKTWDLNRRLETWAKNDKYFKPAKPEPKPHKEYF